MSNQVAPQTTTVCFVESAWLETGYRLLLGVVMAFGFDGNCIPVLIRAALLLAALIHCLCCGIASHAQGFKAQ